MGGGPGWGGGGSADGDCLRCSTGELCPVKFALARGPLEGECREVVVGGCRSVISSEQMSGHWQPCSRDG